MRIPLTKYGLPEVIMYPAGVLAAMFLLFAAAREHLPPWILLAAEALLAALLLWTLCFFRDPPRRCPCDPAVLLAPADGLITEIQTIVTYKKGKYKNALNPRSARVNESNELALVRTDRPNDKLIVRQISGAIARRIVCDARPGARLTSGQKFGMIKFGSRTELYLPIRSNARCLVKVGDKVKAGLTALVRYEQCPD